ncbi:MAG: hypothetical protein PWR01_3587 [Clostridiales bacterium]|jgi:hypothetical protein|nr:hypothetical protein [Clostridiales bacterium]MDN5282514.1 hypothetical protein [Candidatus Ozemobacter sp.]
MSPQIEAFKSLFSELFAKMMAFCLEEEFLSFLGESLEIFYNLQEGEEYEFDPAEEFLFLSWFMLDDEDLEGNALIDEFLRRNADELSLQEMQICKALKETHLTLLQVKSSVPGKSLTLKDLFLGEEFEVEESVGSENALPDSVLFTRVLRLGDTRFLVGAGIFLDASVTEPLTQFITDQYKDDCEDGRHISFKEFLKHNGELINWWIRAYEKGELFQLEDEKPDEDDDGSPDPKEA